jgi:peroxiredoxin
VRWLGELAQHAAELEARDVSIVAIASDSVADTAALQAKVPRLLLLTDPTVAAAQAWGVRLPDADSPSPGTFVVGRDGIVRWRRLEDARGDWPTYAELAAAL